MGNMDAAIRRELATCNGGPGLTAEELAVRRGVTCGADTKQSAGRYVLGDSTAIRRMVPG